MTIIDMLGSDGLEGESAFYLLAAGCLRPAHGVNVAVLFLAEGKAPAVLPLIKHIICFRVRLKPFSRGCLLSNILVLHLQLPSGICL